MGSRLQQVLRSLCFNTGWKYAVFWKLKHQAKMVFTWEDAYYDSNACPDKKSVNMAAGTLNEGSYLHDPFGLIVAKMSYEVYSPGEGIVGQVAVSGKHSWIFLDEHVDDSLSSPKYCGGWQAQVSTGIKTIAVVSVTPHGVVQLGSLHKIAEDLKLVDHIRNVFSELQDCLAGCIPNTMKNETENSCLSDTHRGFSDSVARDCGARLERSFHKDGPNWLAQLFSPFGESVNCFNNYPPLGGFSNELKTKTQESAGCSTPVNEISLPSCSENSRIDKSGLFNTVLPIDGSQMLRSNVSLGILDSPAYPYQVPELASLQLHQDFENLQLPIKSDPTEMQISPFSFRAGYELYEALGTSFQKQNVAWEAEMSNSNMAIEISEDMSSCCLLNEHPDMHLLDAVVAKVNRKAEDARSEKSCYDTEESLLTAEKTHCSSLGTFSSAGGGNICSAGYSFDRDASSSLNSVTCGVESLKGFSSTSSSIGNEHLERSQEAVKVNKKRARPGESCRPRPRDRQLIQDRIKELRELVPSGSKCSIDSLLERTIKHMLFLQSVTKHADKLNKCSAYKLLDKETGVRRFSCREEGSTWAVEVGNNQKVCPVIVENINMNGQMLVEMLCEEYSQFFEIAETIRSLGLTVLKGVSEAYENKTWMCFVVENKQNIHRMDVLWSLMQLLHPKASC